jgi:hypothetical protein
MLRREKQMKYCIATLLALRSVEVGQESPALSLTTHIPLPNVNGRIDHARVDLKGQRLFVAAVANDTREVIDLKSSQRVQTITDLEEPQAVYYRRFHQSPLCSLRWERRHESV